MLAIKRSAGIVPEVNLRDNAQARKHTIQRAILGLKHWADVTGSPKQGYKWSHGKGQCPQKILKKDMQEKSKEKVKGFSPTPGQGLLSNQ